MERDDIALLALTGTQEPYAALKLSELGRTERKRQTTAELSESLREYLYAKYVYRPAAGDAEAAREPLRIHGVDSSEVLEGGR